jgi:hypothetical protein
LLEKLLPTRQLRVISLKILPLYLDARYKHQPGEGKWCHYPFQFAFPQEIEMKVKIEPSINTSTKDIINAPMAMMLDY